MDPIQFAQLLREQTRQADALERIAKVFELMTAEVTAVPDAPAKCLHPLEDRLDFGVTNGLPDWQCKRCQFRSVTPDGTAAEDR